MYFNGSERGDAAQAAIIATQQRLTDTLASYRAIIESLGQYILAAQAVEAYVDMLRQQQGNELPCSEYTAGSQEEWDCLMSMIQAYGIGGIQNTVSAAKLRVLLNALDTVGQVIVDCLNNTATYRDTCTGAVEQLPAGLTAQDAFQQLFAPNQQSLIDQAPAYGDYLESWLASKGGTLTIQFVEGKIGEAGVTYLYDILGQEASKEAAAQGIPNLIVNITIRVPLDESDVNIEQIIRHEIGHILLNLLRQKTSHGNPTAYFNSKIDANFSDQAQIIVDFLTVITGEDWQPMYLDQDGHYSTYYYPGEFFPDMVQFDQPGQAKHILDTYFPNARRSVGPNPDEDFADTFALFTVLQAGDVSMDNATRDALVSTSRYQFFQNHMCCWVYELLGITSEE